MTIFLHSKFRLAKRYLRFSNYEIYFDEVRRRSIRLGYKFYQKIFRRYRVKKTLKINVRKPRIAIKRKTYFGRALEAKAKWSYLLGGVPKSKLARFVRLAYSKHFSSHVRLADSVESRLDVILAKTGLVPYCWMVKRLIKAGYVFVDNRRVRAPHYKVRVCSRVSIRLPPDLAARFQFYFQEKSRLRLLFWVKLPGFEINWRTFSLIKYAKVQPWQVTYPFNFDINYFFRLYPR
jgi:ribosomal protein S4